MSLFGPIWAILLVFYNVYGPGENVDEKFGNVIGIWSAKIKKNELSNLIENYLYKRPNLKQVFVLIDCRVGIKDIDILKINVQGMELEVIKGFENMIKSNSIKVILAEYDYTNRYEKKTFVYKTYHKNRR